MNALFINAGSGSCFAELFMGIFSAPRGVQIPIKPPISVPARPWQLCKTNFVRSFMLRVPKKESSYKQFHVQLKYIQGKKKPQVITKLKFHFCSTKWGDNIF